MNSHPHYETSKNENSKTTRREQAHRGRKEKGIEQERSGKAQVRRGRIPSPLRDMYLIQERRSRKGTMRSFTWKGYIPIRGDISTKRVREGEKEVRKESA